LYERHEEERNSKKKGIIEGREGAEMRSGITSAKTGRAGKGSVNEKNQASLKSLQKYFSITASEGRKGGKGRGVLSQSQKICEGCGNFNKVIEIGKGFWETSNTLTKGLGISTTKGYYSKRRVKTTRYKVRLFTQKCCSPGKRASGIKAA